MLEIRELEDDLRTVKTETVTQVESYASQPNQVSDFQRLQKDYEFK